MEVKGIAFKKRACRSISIIRTITRNYCRLRMERLVDKIRTVTLVLSYVDTWLLAVSLPVFGFMLAIVGIQYLPQIPALRFIVGCFVFVASAIIGYIYCIIANK